MQHFNEYINGKRVALVGPAPSVIASNQHDLIESYDVVCRLNAAIPVPERLYADIGERTDVLYSTTKMPKCMNPDRELVRQTVKWVVCPYAPVEPFDRYMNAFRKWNDGVIPFCCPYSESYYDQIEKAVGSRPTIGLSAIIHLLSVGVAELYVTGLTFFRGGYHDGYRMPDKGVQKEAEVMAFVKRIGVHEPEKEEAWFREAVRRDARLTYDTALKEIADYE